MTVREQPDLLEKSIEAGVLKMTMKAGKAHPLSLSMLRALHDAVDSAQEDDAIGTIVIHGPGRIFCAGHDLKEIASHRADDDHGKRFLHTLFKECSDMMQAVARSCKPTIALVEGLATAGGLQLVASCDLAFASEHASVCLPGVGMDGFCTTPSVAVSRNLENKMMMELALSSETYGAEWAKQAGLLNRVLAEDSVVAETMAFAKTLASRNKRAIALGKETLLRQKSMPLDEAYIYATEAMVEHFMDPTYLDFETRSWGK